MRPDPAIWTQDKLDLWSRIEGHDFEPGPALNFTQRLAADRDWTLPFARAAILEYRRFCFLAVSGDEDASPSEEVDEVWHQHLIYSRDYWDVWCRSVLKAPLHHDPAVGGPPEQDRYRSLYALTILRYEAWFGLPSEIFWPATHARFAAGPRYRAFDSRRRLLLWRPAELRRRLSNMVAKS
jgi:hypothetical protein